MGDPGRKLKWGQWGLKTALASGFLGLVLWYGAEHSVTMAQLNVALASIPAAFVILIEIFNKIADKNDFYNSLYKQFGANKSRGTGVLVSLLFAALGMFVILWALTGTITMNVGTYGPANVVVAGIISLYIFAPETGDDELVLWAWLAATIATKGQYLAIMPGWDFHLSGLSMLVRTLIPAL